ncbi:MAG: glyceraldehyde 3-phosphate dehydrogenase NAD-binding domain-containing protein, partial [Vibrio sp.]
MLKVAINGFGRIGRNVLRAIYESGKHQQIQVVAVNELAKPEAMAHLLQYDTTHGRFAKKITYDQQHIYVHHQRGEYDAIRILHQAEIPLLPWHDLEVDLVFDCTGVYGCQHDGQQHLDAGAKLVLFSHPGASD